MYNFAVTETVYLSIYFSIAIDNSKVKYNYVTYDVEQSPISFHSPRKIYFYFNL